MTGLILVIAIPFVAPIIVVIGTGLVSVLRRKHQRNP